MAASIFNSGVAASADPPKSKLSSQQRSHGWSIVDEPGEFRMISKHQLEIDHRYQRENTPSKSANIGRAWSWRAFGTLHVGDRLGRFYVFEGQARHAAAMLRGDIDFLPCMVYRTNTIEEEARSYVLVNKNRKPQTSLETHKAMVEAKDEAASFVEQVVSEHGYTLAKNPGSGRQLKCVASLYRWAGVDRALLAAMFPLVAEVSGYDVIRQPVIDAILHLEREILPAGFSLRKEPWKSRLVKLGGDGVAKVSGEAIAYYGKGGDRIRAAGLAKALNHKVRIRLPFGDPDTL